MSTISDPAIKAAFDKADPYKDTNRPADPIEGIFWKAQFVNNSESHFQDGIRYPKESSKLSDDHQIVLEHVTQNAGKAFDPKNRLTQESILGACQSIQQRTHYLAQAALSGDLETFLRQKYLFSEEVFAFNGFRPGKTVASSFERYPGETVTLMRAVETNDRVDFTTGRAFSEQTAKQIIEFAFVSQMRLYEDPETRHLAQGISKIGEHYSFCFVVQSLLSMNTLPGMKGDKELFEKEMQAYLELSKNHTLNIGKYPVRFHPLPLAATQFNFTNRIEKLLPHTLSGKSEARKHAQECDKHLFDLARRFHPDDREIHDTIYFLKTGKLKAREEILCRAFLCHKLKIPMVLHCKSSVDRTNVAGAMISALKAWVESGAAIPKDNDGKYRIFAIMNVSRKTDQLTYYPFRELCALFVERGRKITEMSRGAPGYKWNEGFAQHPGLADILPDRYFVKNRCRILKLVAIQIVATVLAIFAFLAACVSKVPFDLSKRIFLNAHRIAPSKVLGGQYGSRLLFHQPQ